MSLRDRILSSADIPSEVVHVPEWDCDVLVKGMTAGDRARMLQRATDAQTQQVDFAAVYPEVIIATVHDPETGEQVFEPSDRDNVMSKAGAAIERLVTVGMRLSGMSADAVDVAGKVSSETPSDGS